MRLRYRRRVVGRMLVCPSIQVPRKSPTVCLSEAGATPRASPRIAAFIFATASARLLPYRLRRTWRPLASKPTVTRASH